MSTVVHIPLSELPESQSLRDRILVAEEIVVQTGDEAIHFRRERKRPGRTAGEMLAMMKHLGPDANAEIDEDWSTDMAAIIRESRSRDRDPWAE